MEVPLYVYILRLSESVCAIFTINPSVYACMRVYWNFFTFLRSLEMVFWRFYDDVGVYLYMCMSEQDSA